MKVVKYIVLFGVIIGLGVFSYFKIKEIKSLEATIAENEAVIGDLNVEITALMEDLNSANEKLPVYQIPNDVNIKAGATLKMSMLQMIDINKANYIDSFISQEEIEDYLGKQFKTNIKGGSILIKEMLRDPDVYNQQIYTITLTPPFMPVGLSEGEMVDAVVEFPTGHKWIAFSGKVVDKVVGNNVVIRCSTAEDLIMTDVYKVCGKYQQYGVFWYLNRYNEDNEDIVAFWPIDTSLKPYVELNPNIHDTTRVINKNVRDYIDFLLYQMTTEENEETNKSIHNYDITNMSNFQAAYEEYKKQLEEEAAQDTENKPEDNKTEDEGTSGLFEIGGGK